MSMAETAAVEALRYPIGRFAPVTEADAASRSRAIDEIARLPSALDRAVAGLGHDQLATPYREDGWTLAQVVHHLADSHIHAYIRTRFALAESNFTVKPYDENRWAEFPDAIDPDVTASLDLLRGLQPRWAKLLRSLSSDDFKRELLHPERGPMTLDRLVQLYAWHGAHHVAHIAGARARHGW